MQTYKDGNIEGFESGEMKELSESLASKMERGEADHGVIGKQPEKGEEIEIHGIKYKVQQVTKRDNVILEPVR